MRYSVVVPTFSRPGEVNELLASLQNQSEKSFEVILADGSLDDSVKEVADRYRTQIPVRHLYHKGIGISDARNWGVREAVGTYVLFFDSDCVIPQDYFRNLSAFLAIHPADYFGGPDGAGEDFNPLQKAISYAMTSFFTTGGIRGRKRHVGEYQPRSFNMGIRRELFMQIGGFSGLKVSEDIDLSIRMQKAGFRAVLIEDALVFHKRRSTFYKFFRQVHSFGSGRIDLQLRHGDALKAVHLLPSVFVVYLFAGLLLPFISAGFAAGWAFSLIAYAFLVMIHSTCANKSILVGILSVYAAFLMLIGYGTGLLKAAFNRYVLKSDRESEKPEITKGS